MKTRQRLKSKIIRIRTSKTDTRYFLVERYYAYAVYLNRYLFEPKFHIYQKAPSQVKTEETVTCFDSKSYNTVTNFNHLLYTPYSKCTDRAGRVYQRFINHLKKGYLIPLALEYNEMLDETTLERAETMPTGRLYVLHVPTETDGTSEASEVLMPVATYVALLLGPDFYKLKEFPGFFGSIFFSPLHKIRQKCSAGKAMWESVIFRKNISHGMRESCSAGVKNHSRIE